MSVFIGEKNKRVELAERKDATNPNLFTGSKDFTGDWINLDQVKQKDKYLDFTAIYDNWGWNGISQYIDVNAGETFTFSTYIKAKAGSTIFAYPVLNTDGENGHKEAGTSPNSVSITTTGDWQRVSATFTVTSDGTIKPRLEGDGNSPFWIAGMKLEHGSVATPWCPALEDYAWTSDITNLQNTANQLEGCQTVDSPDFNTLTDTGVYYITNNNASNLKNNPIYTSGTSVTQWGVLVVSSGNGQRISQVYYPDNNVPPFCRVNNGSTWQSWYELSNSTDLTSLQNKIQANKTDVTNLQSMITGLSTKVDSITTKLSDGTLVQVAHFEASDEQKAVDWSKDDGKGGLPKFSMIDY